MAQEFLHGTDVMSVFKQVGSKAMPKSVTAGGFLDSRPSDGRFDRVLEISLANMVAAQFARTRIHRQRGCGKNVLPDPRSLGGRVFAGQRCGQRDATRAASEIALMQMPDASEMKLERAAQTFW